MLEETGVLQLQVSAGAGVGSTRRLGEWGETEVPGVAGAAGAKRGLGLHFNVFPHFNRRGRYDPLAAPPTSKGLLFVANGLGALVEVTGAFSTEAGEVLRRS
jgi:hypothetical protein